MNKILSAPLVVLAIAFVGWNSFLIKVVNSHGTWQVKARLQCRDPSLALLLQTATAIPEPN